MKSRHILIVAALVLTAAGTGRADFVLTGTQHMDVTTSHTEGFLWNSSTADVLAGGYIFHAYINDEALLRVMRPSDYAIATACAYDTGRIVVSSGLVNYLQTHNSSSVDISGGHVYDLYARETSSVDISGGSVSRLYACDASSVDSSGGSVYSLYAYGTSSVDISGGSVSDLVAREVSSVDISGGSFNEFFAYDTSITTFNGQDFHLGSGLSFDGDRVLGTGTLSGEWFNGTPWTVDILTNNIEATILAISDPAEVLLSGDADCNGTVGLADLSILTFNWDTQSGAIWQMGDFDGDGDVDLSDLSALTFNWGQSYANPPVPEPATMALLVLGACLPLRRRRR